MINAYTDAMGIIFPNIYDKLVPDLVRERLMASIPFAGRYRMSDFVLSSMVNSGVDKIAVICQKNYHSLLDHLGSGREWDLARKNGGLIFFPPYAEQQIGLYGGRIEALNNIVSFLSEQKEDYVIMSDCNIAYNFDFQALLEAHAASGSEVTIVYKKEEIPATMKEETYDGGLFYSFDLNGNRITNININPTDDGQVNLSMNIYCVGREWLIKSIKKAFNAGGLYFERDVIMPQMNQITVNAFEYTGYSARISSMKSYFDENMKLLEDENLDGLFAPSPIYTKIRDDNPTRYVEGAKASNVLVADGCVIEGTVENSVLFRGVEIAKGAVVKNCVLMQDTHVGENCVLENIITDKAVEISAGNELKGSDAFPVYVPKATKM